MSHATQPCADSPALSSLDVDLYIEAFLARWDNPNTRSAYRDDLASWLRWCEHVGLDPIGPHLHRSHVEMWMRWMRETRGNSASTINHRVGRLSLLFELAVDDDLMPKNPCRLVRRPKAAPAPDERIAMNREEAQRFLHAAHRAGPMDYALVMLMAMMGLRISEALSLIHI